MPKFPEITVPLVGEDGNAFAILGRCQKIARQGGVPKEECDEFIAEATAGHFDHLLRTVIEWFETE